jgi:hypothetical protein
VASEEKAEDLREADGPWPLPDGWVWTSLRAHAGPDGLMTDGDWVESKEL